MNKLRNTLLALIALFAFSTSSYAGMSVGISGSYINVEADGEEKDQLADASVQKANVSADTLIGSVYAEYIFNDNSLLNLAGFTIGAEYVPGTADVSSKTKKRTDTELSKSGTATTTSASREFSANAEIENFGIAYVEMPIYSSLYVRLGYAQIDVNTQEKASGNGGTYPNVTLGGLNYGVGLKNKINDNILVKLSFEATDFETLGVSSTGNSANSTVNSVSAELDTWAAKIALGYEF